MKRTINWQDIADTVKEIGRIIFGVSSEKKKSFKGLEK